MQVEPNAYSEPDADVVKAWWAEVQQKQSITLARSGSVYLEPTESMEAEEEETDDDEGSSCMSMSEEEEEEETNDEDEGSLSETRELENITSGHSQPAALGGDSVASQGVKRRREAAAAHAEVR